MPSKIQGVPQGFLGSLSIKGTGKNPVFVSDNIIPVVDLGPNYTARFSEVVFQTTAVTNLGDASNLPVPEGEAWRLISLSAQMLNPGAGVVAKFFAGIRFGGTGVHSRIFTMVEPRTAAANEDIEIGGFVPTPLILSPGSNLTAALSITLAGAENLRVIASIERLEL